MKRIVLLTVVLLALVRMAQAQTQNTDRVNVTLSDPSRPALINLRLVSGGVTVRTHSGRDIIIASTIAGRSARPSVTPDGLRRIDTKASGLQVIEEKNVVTIAATGGRAQGTLEILVPVKTNLNLNTVNGRVLVEDVDGDIEANSNNGEVRLNGVSGSVVAHAGNGSLVANLKELVANKAMSFTSMNGNVDITLPATTRANLRIRADRGDAWTDFDLQQTQVAAPKVEDGRNRGGQLHIVTNRTVTATINGGGADLDVRTLRGSVFIRKAK
jgi:DUF4097 and DUF4098 domain-containing protein YvlB